MGRDSLENIRKELDVLDTRILQLVAERRELGQPIAALKRVA